ncbi:MAG: hypothetical protein COT17_04695 [Elusimicrobia bacterium CG08_land_8_20_14_0_20_51_18]|nr:MAG: hypothetical protein COT17_04695 [Elusimicrobia bacterium CG08_land_8_20_14_0_20_51_18]
MKPTVIKCSKCGYESNIISDTCIKCGAQLEKICGNCGARASVEKNYCDECGKLMLLKIIEEKPAPPDTEKVKGEKASIEFETFDEAIEARQKSYTGKMAKKAEDAPEPAVPPKGKSFTDPFAAKMAEDTTRDKENLVAYADKQKIKDKEELDRLRLMKVREDRTFWQKNRLYVYLLLGVFILLFLAWLFLTPYMPRLRLVLAAKNYLGALNGKDYKTAYDLLSANSKASCPFTDFLKYNERYYSRMPGWEFKDLEIHSISSSGAVVRYRLKEGKGEWKENFLSFVLENGKWTRPYIWHLFTQIDESIAAGDFTRALFLSQKLYLTDPVDPRASGYLCNSEYLMRLYDKSVETCKRTLESAKTYPVSFSEEEFFWYNFYYADSLRFQARFSEAVKIYDVLFDNKALSGKNKCPLLMSRADAHVREGRYYAAKEDIASAVNSCPPGPAKNEAGKKLRLLSGEAAEEAVFLAQRFRYSPGKPNLMEMRSAQIFSVAGKRKLGKGGFGEKWVAESVDGPEYRVALLQEKKGAKKGQVETDQIYSLRVNVWTGFVKMEKSAGNGD